MPVPSDNFTSLLRSSVTGAENNATIDATEMARVLDLPRDSQRAADTVDGIGATAVLTSTLDQMDSVSENAHAAARAFLGRKTPPSATALDRAKALLAAAPFLTAPTLQQATETLSRLVGAAPAAVALRAALPAYATNVTRDGAEWLQKELLGYDRAVTSLQTVLSALVPGAVLLDANANGMLDTGDRIVTDTGVVAINDDVLDRVKIGAAVVAACQDLAQAGHAFERPMRVPGDKWQENRSNPGGFKIKSDIKPSDAILDIFARPREYGFECATAITIARYKAMLDVVGPTKFDELCATDLRVGGWDSSWELVKRISNWGDRNREASKAVKATLTPGTQVYFMNWHVSLKGFEQGWQGENAIYLGDGKFYAHPFGIVTEEQIVAKLNAFRREGSTRSASMLDIRSELTPGLPWQHRFG